MAKKKTEIKIKKLVEQNLVQADYKRTIWHVTVENFVTLEDLLKAEYWAHVAFRFKAGDRLEVIPSDRSFFIELFVLASAKAWAKVIKLREIILIDKKDPIKDSEFKISWKDVDKWRVTQGQKVLSKDHDTQNDAQIWLTNHKKEIG